MMLRYFSLIMILVFSIITYQVYGGGCGNGGKKSGCKDGVCSFDPYFGNETKQILDLEVNGGVGEIQLRWVRYYNSREFHNWLFSFQYLMVDDGVSEQGQPKVKIFFPESFPLGYSFTQSPSNPSIWLPLPGVGLRLFQEGDNFYMQKANGHRYRFERLTSSTGSFYQLQEIHDNYLNLYRLTYNINHNLIRVTEPAGRYLEMKYITIIGNEVLDSVKSSDGRSVKYNYDTYSDGISSWVRLIHVNYGDGTQATYEYAQPYHSSLYNMDFLFVEHAVDPRVIGAGTNMRYTYNNSVAHGYIKEERNGLTNELMVTLNTDAGNRWICYANGAMKHLIMPDFLQGDIQEKIDGLGRSTKYTYQGGNGFIQTMTDPLGRVTTYAQTIYGNPLEITRPDGSKEKWTRDDLDQILSYTDQLGRVTTYTMDSRHRTTRIDYPDGTNEQFTYNGFSQVLTHTRKNGKIEINTYDIRGLKTSFTDVLGNKTLYLYDAADRLASVQDALGYITQVEYNERGLITKRINADGSSQLFTYDDYGNQTSLTNELGNIWKTEYDEFKRVVSTTDPLNQITKYEYDLLSGGCGCSHDNQSPTKITQPSGRVTQFTYDVEWQKRSGTMGTGTTDAATTYYEYDKVGNLIIIIDPKGNDWNLEYDKLNRRTAVIDPLGHKTKYSYNATSNLEQVVRPDGGIITTQFDVMNRVTQRTDPKGQTTYAQYDAEGNLIAVIDAKNQTYSFQYDDRNQRTKSIYPDGPFESYGYDAVGNLIQYINRAGDIRTHTYDNRNREISSTWSDNTPAIFSSYDAASRVLSLSSSVSSLSYTYDAANETTTETQAIDGGATTIRYSYNADGLVNTLTYPGSSTVVSYGYTGRNEIKTIGATGFSNAAAVYSYDKNGNRIEKSYDNGTSTTYAYNNDYQLLKLDNQRAGVSFAMYNYGYDAVHRKTYEKRNSNKGDVYAYDATDQLTGVKYDATALEGGGSSPARTVAYDWDAVGNRNSVADNGTPTSYTTNNLNQYTNVGGNALTYNAKGALKTSDGWTYTYDAHDRLIRAEKGSTLVQFAYDARNRRVRQVINGVTSYLYYNGWNLIEERSSVGSLVAQYVHGARMDELLTKTATAIGKLYYHYNALGSVTSLTNTSGNAVETYSYDVFGKATIKNSSGTVISTSAYNNRFLYTGREWIEKLGLYDYRNRMYNPQLGRFIQLDPLRFDANDVNLYRYTGNNSINFTDPLGLEKCVPHLKDKDEKFNFFYKKKWRTLLYGSSLVTFTDNSFFAYISGTAYNYYVLYFTNDHDMISIEGSIKCECVESTNECKISVEESNALKGSTTGSIVLALDYIKEIQGDEAKLTFYGGLSNTDGGSASFTAGPIGIGIQFPTGQLAIGPAYLGSGKWKCVKE